jgi:hypothetical protein
MGVHMELDKTEEMEGKWKNMNILGLKYEGRTQITIFYINRSCKLGS